MNDLNRKVRAPRNRTVVLSAADKERFQRHVLTISGSVSARDIQDRTVNQDLFEVMNYLPANFVDLLFVDPPYNITKSFEGSVFRERSVEDYMAWFETWFPRLLRTLKKTGSVYVCGDWRSSAAIQLVAEKYLIVRNRVTWEREKGRGAAANWKNCSEDIWFCTVSREFTFNADAVKLKRRVIAPYTDQHGEPKDWEEVGNSGYRLTGASNLWTDLTVPFWSMAENTDHPTQKPEKLLAKIILASSRTGDMVLDPFLGSGTTSVVSKKLGRRYVGIELNHEYCCLAEKRLALADTDNTIQGYAGSCFWERNSLQDYRRYGKGRKVSDELPLFALPTKEGAR